VPRDYRVSRGGYQAVECGSSQSEASRARVLAPLALQSRSGRGRQESVQPRLEGAELGELPRLDYRLRPSRLGIAQASLALLSLLRPFLLGEVRYLSVKKAYPRSNLFACQSKNEAEELFAEAQKMAQLRYKTYVRKTQEDWSE